MEHENELKEALDFVSPSALTYDEWLMVGMALKDSGLPVTLWEQWSTRDAGRYHKGECVKKWESFHGGGASPVTASSIFQLAYSHGWSGPAGHALDWNDDISAGTGAQTEGRLVDPRWVEAHELALPEEWHPADQLKRYLQALFEPDEYVAYVTESFMAADRRRPAKGSWTRTAGQLITELDACGGDLGKVVGDCDPEVGAWICFNPVDGTGRKDANITAYRYALVECDNMELGKQQAIIKQLELPCAALVYSGGKSVHAIVKVDAPDYAEYRRRVDYLYSACQKNGLTIDQQNRNPSRLSRMPGILRGDKRQVLLETNIGCTRPGDAAGGPSKSGQELLPSSNCASPSPKRRPWLGRFSCAQGQGTVHSIWSWTGRLPAPLQGRVHRPRPAPAEPAKHRHLEPARRVRAHGQAGPKAHPPGPEKRLHRRDPRPHL